MQYVYSNTSGGKPVVEGTKQLDDLLKGKYSLRPKRAFAVGVEGCITHYVSSDLSVLHHPDTRDVEGMAWHAHTFIINGEEDKKVKGLVKELHSMYTQLGYKFNNGVEIPLPTTDILSQPSP